MIYVYIYIQLFVHIIHGCKRFCVRTSRFSPLQSREGLDTHAHTYLIIKKIVFPRNSPGGKLFYPEPSQECMVRMVQFVLNVALTV